jgi:hypothetical protein
MIINLTFHDFLILFLLVSGFFVFGCGLNLFTSNFIELLLALHNLREVISIKINELR